MPTPLELPVDVDEVAEAMDVGTRDTIDFFLDMQTGAVVVTGDGIDERDVDADDDAATSTSRRGKRSKITN